MEDQQNNTLTEARSELSNLTIRDLFYKYIRFIPVFVLSVALALFGAYGYLRYSTEIYSTTGTLLLKADQKQGGSSDKFDDLFGGSKGFNIQNEIEVLKSKALMARVVEKKDLQYNYYVKGKIKTINIYKTGPFRLVATDLTDSTQPFSLKIKFKDNNSFTVNGDNTTYSFNKFFKTAHGTFQLVRNNQNGLSKDYTVDYAPTFSAAGKFTGAINVAPKIGGTGIVNISMQGTNPVQCADIVNQLMEDYGNFTKELKNKAADQMIDWINVRMDSLGKELDIAQNNLRRYSEENNLMDLELQQSTYLNNISESDKTINEQIVLLNTADFLLSYLKDKKNEYATLPVLSTFGLQDPTLSGLIGGYNIQQNKRNGLLESNVASSHPFVLELNDQIKKSKESIFESIGNLQRSINRQISEVKRNSNEDLGELQDLRYKSKDYIELKRQVDNKQLLFNVLQSKKEETSISRASNIANTQIVESAYISGTPIKPNRRSIQMMSILIGLLIPALIIFGGEMLNDKVSTRFDVEKITTAPILSEIGHSYSDEVLVVNKTTRSMVAEQFRIIRSNLQYVIGKADRFTLLVTSSFSGEGKSFLSTNLGAVMALAGKKTVILEFDIRKPKVLSGLKMSKGPGITNFLIGKSELSDIIRKVPDTENLYVIGCGPIPPNPSELLLNENVVELFDQLKKEFEVVIVDTAPVGMVSDAQTLSKFVDSTLYMVRQGHTFKKQITLIDEYYVQNKLPKVAIVINDVKLRSGYGYYGYGRYGYGYGYGYGSYYEEEAPPPGFFERMLTYLNPLKWFSKK